MKVTCVYVHVKKEHIEDFIRESEINHFYSVEEKGNFRFDVLQSSEDPCKFLLYEAYETEEAAKLHKTTDHYLNWRKAVNNWMEEPRKGVPYNMLKPVKE